MLVYWIQSIIIGLFNFIRIIQLKEFSTEGLSVNGKAIPAVPFVKFYVAFFFLFHYGFFHLVYLIFILANSFHISIDGLEESEYKTVKLGNPLNKTEVEYILLTALIFFINHLFSYIYNRKRDTKKQSIRQLMIYPYARIIPMHLTLTLGVLLRAPLLSFLLLKTLADIMMHIVEHDILRKGENNKKYMI